MVNACWSAPPYPYHLARGGAIAMKRRKRDVYLDQYLLRHLGGYLLTMGGRAIGRSQTLDTIESTAQESDLERVVEYRGISRSESLHQTTTEFPSDEPYLNYLMERDP
jgi:hypothetical protein